MLGIAWKITNLGSFPCQESREEVKSPCPTYLYYRISIFDKNVLEFGVIITNASSYCR